MASVTYKNGNAIIQFVDPSTGKRKTIRLGKRAKDFVAIFKRRLESLLVARKFADPPTAEITTWILKMNDDEHRKLSDVGLVIPRGSEFLATFIYRYIATRTDLAGRSITNLSIAASHKIGFFGAEKPMREITPANADDFSIHMKGKCAQATAARIIGRARHFFMKAIRAKILTDNPFEGVIAGSTGNDEKKFFVPREWVSKVIDACPHREWRLIIALSRYGGIRCPSETLNLKWDDVLWDQSRFIVKKRKTKSRVVPIFPELLPYLRECFEHAKDGAVHVITRYRDSESNLRTTFAKMVARAGLVMWERPFHNMRASRETELAAEYPLHVVCAWIGNSPKIAAKHYLTVRDADFDRAAAGAAQSDSLTGSIAVTSEHKETDFIAQNVISEIDKRELHRESVSTTGDCPDQDSTTSNDTLKIDHVREEALHKRIQPPVAIPIQDDSPTQVHITTQEAMALCIRAYFAEGME